MAVDGHRIRALRNVADEQGDWRHAAGGDGGSRLVSAAATAVLTQAVAAAFSSTGVAGKAALPALGRCVLGGGQHWSGTQPVARDARGSRPASAHRAVRLRSGVLPLEDAAAA